MAVTESGAGERIDDALDPGGNDPGPLRPAGPGGRPRRRPVLIGLAVLAAAAVLAAGIGVLVYRATYQPLQPGNLGFDRTGGLAAITDGVADTHLIATGAPGTTGTFAFSIADTGSHPVTILGYDGAVPLDPAGRQPRTVFGGYPIALRWSPIEGQSTTPHSSFATARPFPAHLGAHLQLLVWVRETRLRCPSSDEWSLDAIPFRWSALGVDHTYVVTLGQAFFPSLPLMFCYPAAALSHIDRSA